MTDLASVISYFWRIPAERPGQTRLRPFTARPGGGSPVLLLRTGFGSLFTLHRNVVIAIILLKMMEITVR